MSDLQVLNTDAEGRLTLADALVYAEKNCGAEAIIDVATLTGACMVALGTSMCGMFSPNQQLVSQLKQAGSKSGDSPCCSDAEVHFLHNIESRSAAWHNRNAEDGMMCSLQGVVQCIFWGSSMYFLQYHCWQSMQ